MKKTNVAKALLLLAAALTLGTACASSEKNEEQEAVAKQPVSLKPSPDAGASIESKQVAAIANAPFVTEVSFKKGQAVLSREMRARLDKIYSQAIKIGEVDEITSFAWSDKEYPAEDAPELPAAAKGLAENRNASIETAFNSLGNKAKFSKVEMTERPSGIGSKLGLGDTRLKTMFTDAGIQSGETNKRAAPKASKAVVMIVLKK